MKERPILFGAPMVRALLDGRKTQTRRIAKLPGEPLVVSEGAHEVVQRDGTIEPGPDVFAAWGDDWHVRSPYGRPGDRLWVRETFATLVPTSDKTTALAHRDRVVSRPEDDESIALWYRADGEMPVVEQLFSSDEDGIRWRPSIFMPRWVSRITLEVTGVRVERLQAITEEDAMAEGVVLIPGCRQFGVEVSPGKYQHIDASASASYRSLWLEINGRASWQANPWVWVVEFRRVDVASPHGPK